ncbi:MAG: hypoxanthine-guanine phosphoribosyltransferase [Betaproteobacteria bacterium]|nr:hypoxanthine-guanine phosphoribosyltransferase [Betaproteobacteria bacterium]
MSEISKAWSILDDAELVASADEIDRCIVAVADAIALQYRDRYPVLLCVMNGAIYFCGKLMGLLRFPLTLEYVHASRYGAATNGGQIAWRVEPSQSVRGRDVIIVDDILDEGVTLAAIKAKVLAAGATSCAVAVLTNKLIGKDKPLRAEFVGLDIPNRFVFGCGLDVSGHWRNLPAIYAVKGS